MAGFVAESLVDWAPVFISIVAIYVSLWINYDAKRPDIVVYLEFNNDRQTMWLVIQNIGKSTAYDIRFSEYDKESLLMEEFREHVNFLETGIPTPVPGEKRVTVVAADRIKDKMGSRNSSIKVIYRECPFFRFCRGKLKQSNTFTLDYGSFSAVYGRSELYLIRKAIESIERKL